jgi:outer membrane protein OmpA-like peptidoglycan-associated protein
MSSIIRSGARPAAARRFIGALVLAAAAAAASGCALVAVGAGAGAGAIAYTQGRVVRVYGAEEPRSAQACIAALESLKIEIVEQSGGPSGTRIAGRRADGTVVNIDLAPRGPRRTEVGVRTGAVGLTDREASERIHAAISARLAPAGAAAPGPGREPALRPAPRPAEPRTPPAEAPGGGAPAAAGSGPEAVVCFTGKSNALPPGETAKLDALAGMLLRDPEMRLRLLGHGDGGEAAELDRLLAEGRASSVKMYLVGKGAAPSRIVLIGPEERRRTETGRGGAGPPAAGCVEVFRDAR